MIGASVMKELTDKRIQSYMFYRILNMSLPGAYSEFCQTSKVEFYRKDAKYFRKTLHLRYLTRF